MMTFNAGNMPICEGCTNEQYCDEGDLFYCALGEKVDSSECARWQNNLVAQKFILGVGKLIDGLPDEEDTYYRKCKLQDCYTDGAANYFNESWSDDLAFLMTFPYEVKTCA